MKFYTHDDYPLLCEWWTKRNFPPVPKEALPVVGCVADNAAAGFLYTTDSAVAWMEWVVTNPEKTSQERHEALTKIFNELTEVARDMGFKCLFTSTNEADLIKRYESHGFKQTDKNMTNLMRIL